MSGDARSTGSCVRMAGFCSCRLLWFEIVTRSVGVSDPKAMLGRREERGEMEAQYDFGGSSVIDAMPLGQFQIALFAICSLVAMIDGFDTVAVGFVVLDLAKAWNVPVASFGIVFGAGLLGAMLGALAAGALAD